MRSRNLVRLLWVFWIAPVMMAQSTVANTQYDFSIPDSPAATVLNVSSTTITKPTTPRALATSVLNGFDKEGNFQSGIDLAFSPYMLAYGNKVSIATYQKSTIVRFLTRFQTSIATTKGTSDDKSAKIGLGFQATPYDAGDPRTDKDYIRSLDNAIQKADDNVSAARVAAGKSPIPGPAASQDELDGFEQQKSDERKKLLDPLIAAQKKARWNRSSWIIAAAPSWNSPTGGTSDLKWNGGAAWTSIGYGFDTVPGLKDTSEIIAGVQYHDKEIVNSTTSSTTSTSSSPPTTFLQNSLSAGVRVLVGAPATSGSLEAVYVKNRPYDLPREEYWNFTLAIDHQLTQGLWITFSAGGETARSSDKNKLLVRTAFKWGTTSEKK